MIFPRCLSAMLASAFGSLGLLGLSETVGLESASFNQIDWTWVSLKCDGVRMLSRTRSYWVVQLHPKLVGSQSSSTAPPCAPSTKTIEPFCLTMPDVSVKACPMNDC